jgi:FAD synthetase
MVSKYIRNTERVFGEIKFALSSARIEKEKTEDVLETAKRYLEDARYYQKEGKLEIGLASVAYCEGLLDALRLLGVVEFSW